MRYKLSSIFVLFFLSFCKSQISGYYVGYWSETRWEYKLYSNNTFWFRSMGHFVHTRSSGTYELLKDTIILNSISSDSIPKEILYGFQKHKFILDKEDCIIDYIDGYDYCKSNYVLHDDSAITIKGSKVRFNTDFKPKLGFEIISLKKGKYYCNDAVKYSNWVISNGDLSKMIINGSHIEMKRDIFDKACFYHGNIMQNGRKYWYKVSPEYEIEIIGANSRLSLIYKKP